MPEPVEKRLAALPTLNKAALCDLWKQFFHSAPSSQLRRDLMIPILSYRMQEQAFGPLSARAQERLRQPNPPLMKAVARARSWYERVLEGKSSNQRSLTLHAGLTRRYIGKVFGCAFLAPDIVESILEGRQPRDLSFKKLCAHIPLSWIEQREQLG